MILFHGISAQILREKVTYNEPYLLLVSCYLVQSLRTTILYPECALRAVEIPLVWLCSDLTAVGAQQLPVCSLQGRRCCRSWAVTHFWELFLDETNIDICDLLVLVLPHEFRQELP